MAEKLTPVDETPSPEDGEVTIADAITAVAHESPEAAGLIGLIAEYNARQRELMLPTWESFDRARDQAYDRGYREGWAAAREEIYQRLFNGVDIFEPGPP